MPRHGRAGSGSGPEAARGTDGRRSSGRDAKVQDQIKKRREERIRRLLTDPRLAEHAGRGPGEGSDDAWRDWSKRPTYRQYAAKIVLCLVLYAAAWALFENGHPALEPAREAVRRSLTESFRFDQAAAWYHRHIADLPALIPAFGQNATKAEAVWTAPVSGRVVEAYRDGMRGVYMAAPPGAPVRSSAEGLVTAITESPDTGLTVTVRHKAGMETVYGLLGSVRVRKNDWLSAGDVIGTPGKEPDGRTGRLFFAVKRDGKYVDPRDVMALD